jgi:hypothetical protein
MNNEIELTADALAFLDLAIEDKKNGNPFATAIAAACTPTVVTHHTAQVVAFMVAGGTLNSQKDLINLIEMEKNASLNDLLKLRKTVLEQVLISA